LSARLSWRETGSVRCGRSCRSASVRHQKEARCLPVCVWRVCSFRSVSSAVVSQDCFDLTLPSDILTFVSERNTTTTPLIVCDVWWF
jgi:hypothetical protein